MGTRIYELLRRDLYGAGGQTDREPPMVQAVYMSGPTTLVVETDAQSLSANNPTLDFFQLHNAGGAQITAIQTIGTDIEITLDQDPGLNAQLTYRGPYIVTTGNFITNSKNLELVSFYQYPIDVQVSFDDEIMITQYYEGDDGANRNRWLEVKNISGNVIPANRYYLARYNNGSDLNNIETVPPTFSVGIIELAVDETILYKRSGATEPGLGNLGGGSTVIPSNVCNFSGNDVLLISTENNASCYANRVDLIGDINTSNWGQDKAFVRADDALPSKDYNSNEWVELSLEEVNNAVSNSNVALGTQGTGAPVWNGNAWSDGIVPDRTRDVVMANNYNANDGTLVAKDLTVSANLNFDKNSTKSIVVYGDLDINSGNVIIGDQESLVMYDDNAQISGGITKIEKSIPRNNPHDFTYWSSPLKNQAIGSVFSGVSPSRIFEYDQSQSNVPDSYAPWVVATGQMQTGVGYAAEGLAGTTGIHSISFSGQPNNGLVQVPLKGFFGDGEPDNDFNLVGNPYPSAIDLDEFFAVNNGIIDPVVYLWTHETPISGGNSGDFTDADYAEYNLMGGVQAGSGGEIPDYNLSSSQGFFVRAINSGPLVFNNAMRLIEKNDLFFKQSKSKKEKPTRSSSDTKDRIWLNLTTDQGGFDQILIGFKAGLSNGFDLGYDAKTFDKSPNPISFYSTIKGDKYSIQSQRTFVKTRKVRLGFDTDVAPRNFTISIAKSEGALSGIKVYLVDRLTNGTHDLTQSDYEFYQSGSGEFKDRFILRFEGGPKDPDEPGDGDVDPKKSFTVYADQGGHLTVKADAIMNRIRVFDLYGNKLFVKNPKSDEYRIPTSRISHRKILIMEVRFEDGEVKRKKFINLVSNL